VVLECGCGVELVAVVSVVRVCGVFWGVFGVFLCGLVGVFGICGAGSRLPEVADFRAGVRRAHPRFLAGISPALRESENGGCSWRDRAR